MPPTRPRRLSRGLLLLGCLPAVAFGPKREYDERFRPEIAEPAWASRHPVVLFDGGHHEYFTAGARYKPLAELLEADGYEVRTLRGRLQAKALEPADVLVIAGAMGEDERGAAPAFTAEEAGALTAWIEAGGALLLVTDHFPFATPVQPLADALGVRMGGGIVEDPERAAPGHDAGDILYAPGSGLAADHPIIDGRGEQERVTRILSYTGQSLEGPPGSTPLAALGPGARESQPRVSVRTRGGDTVVEVEYDDPVSVSGRCQALAFTRGKGRVVVLGDAALATAQLTADGRPFGMNDPSADDGRLAVNAFRWLSGLLPAAGRTDDGSDPAGEWSGRLETEAFSARVAIRLASDGGVWSGRLRASAEGRDLEEELEDLVVAPPAVSFRARIMGADVGFTGSLDGDLLAGDILARDGAQVVGEGRWAVAPARLGAEGLSRVDALLAGETPAVDRPTAERVADDALRLLERYYVDPERVPAARRAVAGSLAEGELAGPLTPARFAEALSRILATSLDDRHVRLRYEPHPPSERADGDRAERPRASDLGIRAVRILDGNVGFLELTRFVDPAFAAPAAIAAMQLLSGTDALIVDLRDNGGGDPAMVAFLASYFVKEHPTHWTDVRSRLQGETRQYWTETYVPGGSYEGRVFLLTSRSTFSAAEGFAFELHRRGLATIVGETTGGGAHPGATHGLEGPYSIFVPSSRTVSQGDAGDWEGVGVSPDVPTPADAAPAEAHAEALLSLAETGGREAPALRSLAADVRARRAREETRE